jgi:phage terminase small subunit
MTVADRAAFAAYCQAWARWAAAERTEDDRAQERTFTMLMRSLPRFGLSPADRTKLASSEAPPAPTGIAGLLD